MRQDGTGPDGLAQRVVHIIAAQLRIAPDKVTREKLLVRQLGATASKLIHLRTALEIEFALNIPPVVFAKIHTVAEVIEYTQRAMKQKPPAASPPPEA